MANEKTIVHVTHEAVGKIGGIGAVLQGFFTSSSYCEAVDRSILISPLFSTDGNVSDRLGKNGEVLYSSMDGLLNTGYREAFRNIEHQYNVGFVYGRRTFTDEETGVSSSPEVLLIDIRNMNPHIVNHFKKELFEKFGIQSHLYENLWEYEQYVRLAPPAIAALKAIGAGTDSTVIISHEFMGMPTALAGIADPTCDFKSVFYAHEVATMRRIVEDDLGHDTMFYNVMKQAHENKQYVNDVFGDQSDFFKHPLVDAAKYCDAICAVGNYTAKELRFLSSEFEEVDIDIVYNGIPAYQISLADKKRSKKKMQTYCNTLLGFKPDYIFTHVTRLVKSKGLWRDIRVLEHMEREFRTQSKTGVLFLLSTEVAQRRIEDIHSMESRYNWPVAHREGTPDLSGGEADFYTAIQQFNSQSRAIKIIFVNQFGFDPATCGKRMPEDMEFMDIRKGSDVEFGQSIYEPFGIAQLEPLTFGGICVVTNVCGCAGFVMDIAGTEGTKNVVLADYTRLNGHKPSDPNDLKSIDMDIRNVIEHNISEKVAMQVCSRLCKSDIETQKMIEDGYNLAKNMSWDVVIKKHLLPTLNRALSRQRKKRIYISA
ncbi:MAG: glycosyltransferase family 4 protein [Planctomycetes bacterium]|nr:glycosyltransferase family 4 protein [Planctomycetota bacterium]